VNFLKRAILSVTRKKGKSIILFVIFFAITNLVLAGFAIQHATQTASAKAAEDVKKSLSQSDTDNLKLVFSFDRQKVSELARQSQTSDQGRYNITVEPITEAMANKIAKIDHILDYNYVVNGGGMADGFTTVDVSENASSDTESSNNNSNNAFGGRQGGFMAGNASFTLPDITIIGVSSTELSDEFNSGGDKLIEGRHIDSAKDAGKKVVIIEKSLADQNDLKVGSKIKIKPVGSDNTTASVKYTVVGIYQADTSSTTSSNSGFRGFGGLGFMQPSNTIFMDYKSAIPTKFAMRLDSTATGGIDQTIFFADDISNIDSIKAAAQKLSIDWDKFVLTSSYDNYKRIYQTTLDQTTKSIDSVASISKIIVISAGIIGAIILALILLLSIKERMYETGVLLSMGEGKVKVISQYLIEVLMVAVIAFGVSILSGNVIDQKIGDSMLNSQIQNEQAQAADMENAYTQGGPLNGGQAGRLFKIRQEVVATTKVEAPTSIQVEVTSKEVAQTAGAGLLVILLAIIIPASTIMRYKPKTILTKAT